MGRAVLLLLVVAVLAVPAQAEFRTIDLTIFGMD
jgi:hypothetical protein